MKLLFKRLLFKFVSECKFTFLNSFFNKLMDVQWVAHSVTFSDIYMAKLENDIVVKLRKLRIQSECGKSLQLY